MGSAKDVGGVRLITHDAGELGSADELRGLALDLRARLGAGPAAGAAVVAVAGVAKGRPAVLVATNEEARAAGVKAGALVRTAAGILGGGGGGTDDVAQGGGTDPAKIVDALAAVADAVAQR